MTREISHTAALKLLDTAPCGIIMLARDNTIIWCNANIGALLGLDPSPLAGQHAASLKPLAWLFESQDIGYIPAAESRPARWLRGWREKLDGDGQAIFLVDVTEQQRLHAENNRLTQQFDEFDTRDSLTGLANRRALLQNLEPLVSRSRRYGNPFSVIRIRTDDPAQLDKRYGTGAGKSILVSISRELKDQLRWTDIVGRLDGGEFLLILPETARDAATDLATKIAQQLAITTLKNTDNKTVALTTRYGVTGWEKGDDSRKLLERVARLANEAAAAPNHIAVG